MEQVRDREFIFMVLASLSYLIKVRARYWRLYGQHLKQPTRRMRVWSQVSEKKPERFTNIDNLDMCIGLKRWVLEHSYKEPHEYF